jgi:hypothetical protein
MIYWAALKALLSPFFALLKKVPAWAWCIAAALAWGAYQRHDARVAGARALKAEQTLAAERLQAKEAVLLASKRVIDQQKVVIDEARNDATNESVARAAVSGALARLLVRYHTQSRGLAAASAPAGSAPTDASVDLCAGLLAGAGEVSRQLAEEATRARRAGQRCERLYDALGQSR